MKTKRQGGFTILELLIVIAILLLLSGMIFAATGPAREKSRQSVCLSNMHQFGQAIAMYRADYDGSETGSNPDQCGLPTSPYHLLPYMGNNTDVLHCPDVPADIRKSLSQATSRAGYWSHYQYDVWREKDIGPLPPFGEAIAQRGSQMPIIICGDHDFPPKDRPSSEQFEIFVRLDGSASARYEPRNKTGWEW